MSAAHQADHAKVGAHLEGGALLREVRADGRGGLRPAGSGMIRLGDRIAVLHGRLRGAGGRG
jgi:hypothetical protein